MSHTEGPDFDRAAEGRQILHEARQDRDEIKRLRASLQRVMDIAIDRDAHKDAIRDVMAVAQRALLGRQR